MGEILRPWHVVCSIGHVSHSLWDILLFITVTKVAPTIDQFTWWKTIKQSGVSSDFFYFVVSLLQSPASIELIFSIFGQIHTKSRTRFGNNRTSKLMFCYSLMREDVEIDYWWYGHEHVTFWYNKMTISVMWQIWYNKLTKFLLLNNI